MTYFGVCPPSRACVAVDLPPPVRIKLDCIAYAEVDPNERQCLHVQGLSYWAPANIGPYSQAIMVCRSSHRSREILDANLGRRTNIHIWSDWLDSEQFNATIAIISGHRDCAIISTCETSRNRSEESFWL
jgi:hypothetical protein